MTRAPINRPFWLVFEEPGRPLTMGFSGSGETLPVFSFAAEAGLFLSLTAGTEGLRIGGVTAEELILVFSRRPTIERIVLDPPRADWTPTCFVSFGRRDFLGFLRRKARTDVPDSPIAGMPG